MEFNLIAITDNETGNPQVLFSNSHRITLSVIQARQLALQILVTAERAEALSQIYPALVVINGEPDASKITGTLRRKLKGNEY